MEKLAQQFTAISDETRLRILNLLLNAEEVCVCDIETALGLPQTKISRHLSILRNCGLVKPRREGVWKYYKIVVPSDEWRAVLESVKILLGVREECQKDLQILQTVLACEDGHCNTPNGKNSV